MSESRMIYLMNLEYMRRRKENVGGANVSSYIPMTCRATNSLIPVATLTLKLFSRQARALSPISIVQVNFEAASVEIMPEMPNGASKAQIHNWAGKQ